MRRHDLLDVLALEHRDLHDTIDRLQRATAPEVDELRDLVRRVAIHEACERVLVHPLLDRGPEPVEAGGLHRSEQHLLASRLSSAVLALEAGSARRRRALTALQRTFIGLTDRDELETYPRVRRLVDREELQERRRTHEDLVAHLLDAGVGAPGDLRPLQTAERHASAHLGGRSVDETPGTITLPEMATPDGRTGPSS